MDAATISLAQAIAALGATGILALMFLLWLFGKIHSDTEVQAQKKEAETALAFREQLRLEAVADRKAADERVDKLVETNKESNELTRRTLDLNERLFAEFVRPPQARTRRTDRGDT